MERLFARVTTKHVNAWHFLDCMDFEKHPMIHGMDIRKTSNLRIRPSDITFAFLGRGPGHHNQHWKDLLKVLDLQCLPEWLKFKFVNTGPEFQLVFVRLVNSMRTPA